ncbi:MAG: undecaprenyl/decaprenyl-phosphate alpha-N-acetylglucosaminyl 1-phosphate transferase [bacterium]|nr:undecaprenyl/decaprenyl-phosphate alpha-N-acetylglucosaminyl 1-phosphate transferase [bacterium]
MHSVAKPLLGGLGIFTALIATILIHYYGILILADTPIKNYLPIFNRLFIHIHGMKKVEPQIWGIISGAFFTFVLGLFDDKYGLSAKLKLVLQILIALYIIHFFNIRITMFIKNPILTYAITVLWIIGITNSFNLLDNMDGLSAGVALVASLVFLATALSAGQLFIGLFLIAFIGALAGFLRYNFPPSTIFMGDAGSLTIGFIMATLTVMGTYYIKGSAPTLYPIFMPVLILGVPIFDTLSVIVIRLKNKESIFTADKNHFSHRLLRLGMTHRGVALFVYLVTFCVAINAILLPLLTEIGVVIVAAHTVCILAIIALLEYYGKLKKTNKNE